MVKKIPLTISTLILALGPVANFTPVSATEPQEMWSAYELVDYSEEFRQRVMGDCDEYATNEDERVICRAENYQAILDGDDVFAAYAHFRSQEFMIAQIIPSYDSSFGLIRTIFFDQDLEKLILNEPVERSINRSFFVFWAESEKGTLDYNSYETIQNGAAEGEHVIAGVSSPEGVNAVNANATSEYLGAQFLDNTTTDLYYIYDDGSGKQQYRLTYRDSADDNCDPNMEYMAMFTSSGFAGYQLRDSLSRVPWIYLSEEFYPYFTPRVVTPDPEPVNPDPFEPDPFDPLEEDPIENNVKNTSEPTIIRETVTNNVTRYITLASNNAEPKTNTTEKSNAAEKTNADTKTNAESETNAKDAPEIAVPLAAGNTTDCKDPNYSFVWLVVLLIILADILAMWWVLPKKSKK